MVDLLHGQASSAGPPAKSAIRPSALLATTRSSKPSKPLTLTAATGSRPPEEKSRDVGEPVDRPEINVTSPVPESSATMQRDRSRLQTSH